MTTTLDCIIIDDEKSSRENLQLLLESYCPEVNIIGEADNQDSIISLLSTSSPDLVFMDIQLSNQTIFEVLNKLKTINFKIVFVTAYDQYAIQGYQYDAIDYLLKPLDITKLVQVIEKTKALLSNDSSREAMYNEFELFQTQMLQSPKISVTDAKGVHVIYTKDIVYCKSDGNYTTFTLTGKKTLVISKNLKHFETKLKDYNFVRIHKSYLINLNCVDFLTKEDGGSVIMKNGISLPISRTNKKALYEKMNML